MDTQMTCRALQKLYPLLQINVDLMTEGRRIPILRTRFLGSAENVAATMPCEIREAFIEAVEHGRQLESQPDALGVRWFAGRSRDDLNGECYAYCFTGVDAPDDAEFYPRGLPSLRVQGIVKRAIARASNPKARESTRA